VPGWRVWRFLGKEDVVSHRSATRGAGKRGGRIFGVIGLVALAASTGVWAGGAVQKPASSSVSPGAVAAPEQRPPYVTAMLRTARQETLRGVPAYQPAGTKPAAAGEDPTALAVIGIPLVPTAVFPHEARAAVFALPALGDRQFVPQLKRYLAGGGRALITGGLAQRLGRLASQYADRIYVLRLTNGGKPLAALPQDTVDSARNFLIAPLGLRIQAPPRVLFHFVGRDRLLVENWNPWAAGVKINFRGDRWPGVSALQFGAENVPVHVNLATFQVPPRSSQMLRVAKG
jgi:hypothetical protein